MDQADFAGWFIILMGCAVSTAGIVKGAMSLFVKKHNENEDGSKSNSWDIDGGGLILAIFLVLLGAWVMGEGIDFPE